METNMKNHKYKKTIWIKYLVCIVCVFLLISTCCMLTGCDIFDSLFDSGDSNEKEYDSELPSATGKWQLIDDADTYFIFDGAKNAMTYRYVEDGSEKYHGTFRVVYKGLGKDVLTPLTFIFTRSDKNKEDWVGCYAEHFDSSFTQFTVMSEEEDLGMIDGSIHTHIYRISELPYKMGSYVLEGHTYTEESNDYSDANKFCIPNGTYVLESGEAFTFLSPKPRTPELFRYVNGDIVVEGVLTIAEDKKTVYLYIENDPYNKVTNADKDRYDTTFGIYYPPDFYLRGDFSNPDRIVINGLYRHTATPSTVEDSTWVFGTYSVLRPLP